MLFLINIHWTRRAPHPDKPASGKSTIPTAARYRTAAFRKAQREFRKKYANHLEITDTTEVQDPAGIYAERRDCGSGQDYGICRECGRGHGFILMSSTVSDALPRKFVEFLTEAFLRQSTPSVRRLHRGLILRWILWGDGLTANAIPGYDRCPPAGRNGFPAGWTLANFRAIAREAAAPEISELRTAHKRPALA